MIVSYPFHGEVTRRVFSAVTEGFLPRHRRLRDFKSPFHRYAVPLPTSGEETA